MSLYERFVLPRFINCACGSKPIMKQRAKVVPRARGTVLEIGIGTGLNLAYYDAERVERLIGLDPSERAWDLARERAENLSFPLEFIGLASEDIPLADASVDTVVVTYSLCTIDNPVQALAGMRRVLRPGGELLFCEHGRAPDPEVSRWQDRLNGAWSVIAGGCRLNRDIPAILTEGGFTPRELETMYLPGTPRFAGYNYWGAALRS